MASLLSGIGMLIGAVALLYPFIPAKGTIPNRSDWIDIMVTMTCAAMLCLGVALIFVGVASCVS